MAVFHFRETLRLPEPASLLCERLAIPMRSDVAKHLPTLLANLIQAGREGIPLCISRHKGKVPLGNIRAQDTIVFERLARMETGHRARGKSGRQTELHPLPRLFELLGNDALVREVVPRNRLLVLRVTNKTGKIRETYPARSVGPCALGLIRRYNSMMASVQIQFIRDGRWITAPTIAARRVYRMDLEHGGRWYHPLQNIPRPERLSVRIDGQECGELDFSGCQPRILYALEGLGFEGDVYGIKGHRRNDVKRVMQSLLFDTDPVAACRHLKACQNPKRIKAYRQWLETREHDPSTPRPSCLHDGFEPLDLSVDVNGIIEDLIELHSLIAHRLSAPHLALKLQNHEARITTRIIRSFVEAEKPLLPVHDSFVVKLDHLAMLEEAMCKAFKAECGDHDCPIKTVS